MYTKRSAIEKSILIWTWLSDNPGYNKEDAYIALGFGTDEDVSLCPCCEYATQEFYKAESSARYKTCDNCPVWSSQNLCYHRSYGEWQRSRTQEAAKIVLKDIVAAKERLDVEEAVDANVRTTK